MTNGDTKYDLMESKISFLQKRIRELEETHEKLEVEKAELRSTLSAMKATFPSMSPESVYEVLSKQITIQNSHVYSPAITMLEKLQEIVMEDLLKKNGETTVREFRDAYTKDLDMLAIYINALSTNVTKVLEPHVSFGRTIREE